MAQNKKKKEHGNKDNVKDFLFKLVDEHPKPNWKIIGALSAEGLLEKYEYEKNNHEHTEIKPSITKSELNDIIIKYYGEWIV